MNTECVICGEKINPTPRGKYCRRHAHAIWKTQCYLRRVGLPRDIEAVIAHIKWEESTVGGGREMTLKSCPFCGGKAEEKNIYQPNYQAWHIARFNCGARRRAQTRMAFNV